MKLWLIERGAIISLRDMVAYCYDVLAVKEQWIFLSAIYVLLESVRLSVLFLLTIVLMIS